MLSLVKYSRSNKTRELKCNIHTYLLYRIITIFASVMKILGHEIDLFNNRAINLPCTWNVGIFGKYGRTNKYHDLDTLRINDVS